MADFKFGRKFILEIDTVDGEVLTIQNPFTLEFSCKRNNLATANTGSFKIYNLSQKNRDRVYKDRYDTVNLFRRIVFKAGYEDINPTVFQGNILEGTSTREGVNVVTTIEAHDGGNALINSVSNATVRIEDNQGDILQKLGNDLKDIDSVTVGSFDKNNKRGRVLFGNTAEILRQESDDTFFIDSNKAYLLKDEEVIDGDVRVINFETGLLESPVRSETFLTFKILFEPALKVGQVLELRSLINPLFDGQYKVVGFEHNGVISDAVGGECATTVNLFAGTQSFINLGR